MKLAMCKSELPEEMVSKPAANEKGASKSSSDTKKQIMWNNSLLQNNWIITICGNTLPGGWRSVELERNQS